MTPTSYLFGHLSPSVSVAPYVRHAYALLIESERQERKRGRGTVALIRLRDWARVAQFAILGKPDTILFRSYIYFLFVT